MKRLFLISICTVFVMTSAALHAQERVPKRVPLGKGNVAVKLDYILFTDSQFDKPGNQDDGLYIGLEGYGKIFPNLYLGGEVGQGINIGVLGEDISFVPIELNLKYAIEAARNFVIDFGAGVSYSYVELRDESPFRSGWEERSDWLFGGQFFADLTYKIHWFSIGVNTKYQVTQGFRNEGFDLSNWRIGAQIGVVF